MGRSLSILDVGHGNCAVLVDEKGVVVIDTGPGPALLSFLLEEQIRRVEVVLISHADKDHLGGLTALLYAETIEIGKIYLNSNAIQVSQAWEDIVHQLDTRHRVGEIEVISALTEDQSGLLNQGDVEIQVLAPRLSIALKGPGARDAHQRKLTTNSVSAVIRLVQHGQPLALFPGDIDDIGLANIAAPEMWCAPLLVFPHHGGHPGQGKIISFAERLCELVQPQTIVFSYGRDKYSNPNPDLIAAIRRTYPHVRILCTQLSKHCQSALPAEPPDHLTRRFAHGRSQGKCCAGTLVIPLNTPDPTLLPRPETHHAFIGRFRQQSLCLRKIEEEEGGGAH